MEEASFVSPNIEQEIASQRIWFHLIYFARSGSEDKAEQFSHEQIWQKT